MERDDYLVFESMEKAFTNPFKNTDQKEKKKNEKGNFKCKHNYTISEMMGYPESTVGYVVKVLPFTANLSGVYSCLS